MANTAAAAPFGDDWNKSLRMMQEALGAPAVQKAIKAMEAAQAPAWREAMKQYDLAAKIKLPSGIDFSAVAKAIRANQNAEVQAAINRLSSESSAIRWQEVARQIRTPALSRVDQVTRRAIAELQQELEAAHAPGIGGDAVAPASGKAARLPSKAKGFDWIDTLPRKAQLRLLIIVLSVVVCLNQGAAEATDTKMPPGLAGLTGAGLVLAGALNERVGLPDDDPEDED